jgi:predicted HTH domain antitoxin
MTRKMIVEYPESIPALLNKSLEAFEQEARLAMAVKLYELGRLSSGQAANLAGLNRVEFLLGCSKMGVPSVDWDESELVAEFHSPDPS